MHVKHESNAIDLCIAQLNGIIIYYEIHQEANGPRHLGGDTVISNSLR